MGDININVYDGKYNLNNEVLSYIERDNVLIFKLNKEITHLDFAYLYLKVKFSPPRILNNYFFWMYTWEKRVKSWLMGY